MTFPLLILFDIIPSCPVQPLTATTTLSRTTVPQWHSSALSPFPLRQVRTGSLPTAPSARTGVPVKHAQGLHSASVDEEEPPQLVSDGFEGGDSMAAMCIERMERKGAAAGPPVICCAHVQVWAGVKQPVTGHLVPIRQLSSTRGDLRNNTRPRLAPPPC
jgi:hypothetical protein